MQSSRPFGGAPHATPKPSDTWIPTRGARGRAPSAAPDSVDDRIGAHGRRPSTRPRASACCRSRCRSSPPRLNLAPSKTEVAEYKRETGRKGARILPFLESSSKTASSLRENAVLARPQAGSRNNEEYKKRADVRGLRAFGACRGILPPKSLAPNLLHTSVG